jgi:RNA polymerase sigma-70 factor (TIGR02960 family)
VVVGVSIEVMIDASPARAQGGDNQAFEVLVAPYRRELHAHCYRILGSFQDAEDMLQETLVSAWQSLDRFDGRALRAWLYRIATNRCLNYLRDSARRPQPAGRPQMLSPATAAEDPWWLEPYPDALIDDAAAGPEARYDRRESIALAFVAALQHLPVQQRAALVLRDVLGFSAAETAEILATSPTAINSALQRARSGFRPPPAPDQVNLPGLGRPAGSAVVRFVDAFERGDLDAVVALLTDDAKVTMPPEPIERRGRSAIAELFRSQGFWHQPIKVVPIGANLQPGFAYYLPDPHADLYRANGLLVLTVSGEHISAITRFGDRGLFARFGLPRTLRRSE